MRQSIFSVVLGLAGASLVLSGEAAAAAVAADAPGVGERQGHYVKPHAPVEVRYKVLGQALPGQPVQLEITLWPTRAAEAVSADFRTGRGMQLLRRDRAQRLDLPSRALATRQVLTLKPDQEGLHRLTVMASVQVDGNLQSRVVGIPIQVGDSRKPVFTPGEPMGELLPDAEGGELRMMKGVQTIR